MAKKKIPVDVVREAEAALESEVPVETAPARTSRKTPAALSRKLESFTVREVPRAQIVGAPYNPRYISEKAKKKLAAGLKKLGLLAPLTWNERTGNLIGGHQRLGILDAINGSEDYALNLAVVNLTDAEEKEANILLNNPEAMGEWDLEKLEQMLGDPAVDLDATGFDAADVYRLFGDAPLQQQALDDLAGSLRSVRSEYEGRLKNIREKQLTNAFYTVLVFRDPASRDAAHEVLGFDSNMYQDGRYIVEKLKTLEQVTRMKTDAPAPDAAHGE